MRSGESRSRAGQAEPMEYPRTSLDQSRGTVSSRVVFQNKHFRGRQVWSTPLAPPRSVPIDKGGARETSLDKLRLHGNTFERAPGVEQSFVQAMQGLAVLALGSDDSRLREYCS